MRVGLGWNDLTIIAIFRGRLVHRLELVVTKNVTSIIKVHPIDETYFISTREEG
jgi:hypothetical protein